MITQFTGKIIKSLVSSWFHDIAYSSSASFMNTGRMLFGFVTEYTMASKGANGSPLHCV